MELFTLTIDMGNDAMNEAYDVAAKLIEVGQAIRRDYFGEGHTESILDDNGNRVGSWKFSS
jgi:hypothetical protein